MVGEGTSPTESGLGALEDTMNAKTTAAAAVTATDFVTAANRIHWERGTEANGWDEPTDRWDVAEDVDARWCLDTGENFSLLFDDGSIASWTNSDRAWSLDRGPCASEPTDVTEDAIRELSDEAGAHGDTDQVRACELALLGSSYDRALCAGALA